MEEILSSPVFANRYQFKPVGDDWDTGRSGFTHLVYDLKEKRLGIIKRAEINSKQAVKGLENEVAALRALKEFGVPEVYDTGTAIHGSKKYFYMIMEYIDGMRVERNLGSLGVTERVDILTQFFGLLAEAHRRGIVNGDVDLKHLFWRREKRELVVIDWGNAEIGVDPSKQTEFAYDLARGAEIIYSLVTRQGQPPARGSIALPDDSEIISGLLPVPVEFRKLCKWAPRTPTDGNRAPYTSLELFRASKQWLLPVGPSDSHASTRSKSRTSKKLPCLLGIMLIVGIILSVTVVMFVFPDILNLFPSLATATEPEMEITSTLLTETSLPSQQPSPTVLSTIVTLEPTLEPATPTEIILEPTEEPTLAPVIIPSARTYDYVDIDTFHADINKTLVFNNKVTFSSKFGLCWRKANSPSDLKEREGFFRRGDYDWWAFDIGENRAIETPVWSSLHECVAAQTIEAVALNAYVTHLEPQKESTREGEFGLFLESQNGNRREYILWIDKDAKMNLRVLENGSITDDNVISVVGLANLQRDGSFLSEYYKFPIQVFLEINNQGFDILYLQEQEPPYQAVQAFDIQPSQMLRIDHALRPTMDNIQKIGLTGRGGGTRVLIWPIAFFSITPGP